MTRIEVEPGFSVPARYVELEDDEQLCPDCHGKGRVVVLFAARHHEEGTCFTCHGAGKIASCSSCGKQRKIVKNPTAPWTETLCLDCIRQTIKDDQA